MMIKNDNYSVVFNEAEHTVFFTGSLRLLNLVEYDRIKEILEWAYRTTRDILIIDVKGLMFLNSSGITTLSVFIISARKQNGTGLKVVGDKNISWQEKSLMNFNKLWNDVEILM